MTPLRAPLNAEEREALRSAAQWYARLSSGVNQANEQQEWQHWHDANPLHRQAWQQVEAVREMVGCVPGNVAVPALQQAQESRRRVLRQLLVLAGFGAVGWAGWESEWATTLTANYHTAVGSQRAVVLEDGSRVLLDSHSALDVRYDSNRRVVRLLGGRIMVQTGKDALVRPFVVETAQGQIQALGTRFTVQIDEPYCEVAVLEKAVQVCPQASNRTLRLDAGQHVRFDRSGFGKPMMNDESVASWRTGSLIAIKRPLGELLAELSRYRRGWLRCDPSIYDLRVSGAFPVDDTDRALAALESGFDLRIVRRTDYWVSVMPQHS